MSIHVALTHRTTYRYDRPIGLGPQVVRLRPAPHCRTPILAYTLDILPRPHFLNWQQDPSGNFLARLVFPEPTTRFEVVVDLVADMAVINPFDFFLEPTAEEIPVAYDPVLDEELAPYRKRLPLTPLLARRLAAVDLTPRRTVDFLVDLNQSLQRDIGYIIRMEPGVQMPERTLERAAGSCRDTGWLLVQMLRHLGFAARFVSGYLIQLVPDQKPLDGPAGPPRDFTDLHAWAEVYLPGAGWVGLDPTSGLFTGEGHIPLAATPEPSSAAPIDGLIDECEVTFDVGMAVSRIAETPRVTRPYAPEVWAEIEALGHRVDARLEAGDVRLTMGGEPTFVSIDDMDGAEWNTEALGATKRKRAETLIRRLARRFAPGHVLHTGQGKWYPGEQLPRWALTCLWRADGEPVWRDPALLADPNRQYGATPEQALRVLTAIAERLGIDPEASLPGFEDVWYYLWRERRLPVNVDPFDSRLSDEMERARLARLFETGLDSVVGHVLPLTRTGSAWQSGRWFFRSERMYLIPGDSPMGYRLPLDSLPWVAAGDYPFRHEADPLQSFPPLPSRAELEGPARRLFQGPGGADPALAARAGYPEGLGAGAPGPRGARLDPRWRRPEQDRRPPERFRSDPGVIRTALCAEPREGRLHLFLPPLEALEDWLELVATIEAAAAAEACPVVIEGYLPPADPRLEHFSVTPDPGVIEVNIHPARRWDQLVERTRALYDEARATRLGTEKFMLDGRHVGTGGGNHIVLGGPSAAQSPLLRRPDLLRSLVGYWQNHPALSYLFSGLFIGPTSQHPRVDEARDDALYELELAFGQVAPGVEVAPWLVDRIFRNLLVDATGNTHRAEFCIDKLYDPAGPGGRRGLLELRAFEMPPHAEMSLAQQGLLRALVALFWERPYTRPPIRWGTRLHDEFMLPHFVWQDLAEVCADLEAAGLPVHADWFRPHWEFRFPAIGRVARRSMEIELRHALEPWHVLGEQGGAGGTVRYVDSSVERMQLMVRGMVGERHVLAVNGAAVPLRPTGTAGEYVAGLRYRAWQPPEALHPTIPIHAPLVVDLFDGWSGRSIGGCTYHVAHPGGRSWDRFPVNANEAEARRRARFFAIGHTPGVMPDPAVLPTREAPVTLDLRRASAPPPPVRWPLP